MSLYALVFKPFFTILPTFYANDYHYELGESDLYITNYACKFEYCANLWYHDFNDKKKTISNREERCSHMQSYLETFTQAAGTLFTDKPEPTFDNAQAVSYSSLLTPENM